MKKPQRETFCRVFFFLLGGLSFRGPRDALGIATGGVSFGGLKEQLSRVFVIQRVSLPQKEPLAVSIFEMFLTKLSFLPGDFENRSVCFLVRDIDTVTRWWQLKYFPFSPRTLGKMNPF